MRFGGHVARIADMKYAYRILVGKSEERKPVGSPRSGCEDNIKADLKGTGYEGID
jgi:hypothetical protein